MVDLNTLNFKYKHLKFKQFCTKICVATYSLYMSQSILEQVVFATTFLVKVLSTLSLLVTLISLRVN